MKENKKGRIIKLQTKQVHFDCELALYKKFEEYCHRNGKDVSKAIRAYMKMCIGEWIIIFKVPKMVLFLYIKLYKISVSGKNINRGEGRKAGVKSG